jgi:adenine-specific DNA-methyltransferase
MNERMKEAGMQKIDALSPEARSANVVSDNLTALRKLFPEILTEGPTGPAINVDVIKALVGDLTVTDSDEKYGLNWHGKRAARQIALTPSVGTLLPCPDESVNWQNTKNLFIEGDNLEVLKLLQKSYAGKVKLIYIDPPYNTGSDFVYPDDFQDTIRNYLELTGQSSKGRRVSSNSETSGRYHTDWLNMMYPRIKLARNLLADDGAIFVTLDDIEVANLRLLMDEIFGSENFVGSIVWKKKSSPDARDTLGSVHDWILCYAKDADNIKKAIGKIPLAEERVSSYSNPDGDPRGNWASTDMTGMTGRATSEQYYPVTLPSGRVVAPPEGRSWGISKATFEELLRDGRIWFGKSGDGVPRMKKFLSESEGQVVPSLWDFADVGSNEEAKKEINRLMEHADVFDTPKPVRLIQRIIEVAAANGEAPIVMDFFAGSGTTGHAAMLHNARKDRNVRFILVQLPEPLDPGAKSQTVAAKYCDQVGRPRFVSELTKERLARAAKEIELEYPNFSGDLGFRVFKLASSNIRAWRPDLEDVAGSLLNIVNNLEPDRSNLDIFFELLLKLGIDLSVSVETKDVSGGALLSVGSGAVTACLSQFVTKDDVETLATAIVEWHRKLAPAGDVQVIFRDSAFADDIVKSNIVAILGQSGLRNIRTL